MSGNLLSRSIPRKEHIASNHVSNIKKFELFNQGQFDLFGKYAGKIDVGVNPNATIAVVNPRFQGLDFGVFRVPTFKEIISQDSNSLSKVLSVWSRLSSFRDDAKSAYVPPETGRAILLPESSHRVYRDLLIKGTGLVNKFTVENKLRTESRGFNGVLELSEAERDFVHTDILERAGVLVVAGVGIVDHHLVQQCADFTAWIGNYVRAFRVQTRISNLFELTPLLRKAAIDDAMSRMNIIFNHSKSESYADYFMTVLKISARNVAIMQAIGFTQDSFHYGQVTLCGELVDFGGGNFNKPKAQGEVNSMYPWFRFDRQPILMQNMMFKTHAVKGEPHPVLLDRNSNAVMNQKTLFGAIRSFDPEAALEIEKRNPVKVFWETYEKTYNCFDSVTFQSEVLNHIERDYFTWDAEKALSMYSGGQAELIYNRYYRELTLMNHHFENQVLTWDRRGPSSVHRMILFFKVIREAGLELKYDFSTFWPQLDPYRYFNKTNEFTNPVEDISWKIDSKNC